MSEGKYIIGVFIVLFVFMGVDSYAERGRTLECRTQAHSNGASIADSVILCKH